MKFLKQFKQSFSGKKRREDENPLQGNSLLSEIAKDRSAFQGKTIGQEKGEENAKKSLHDIYAIETIDVKSVRKLEKVQKKQHFSLPPPIVMPSQLELSLGDRLSSRFPSVIDEIDSLLKALRNKDHSSFTNSLHSLYERAIVPWIERRNGIATKEELEERFIRLLSNLNEGSKLLQEVSKFYKKPLFSEIKGVDQPEDNLFCINEKIISFEKVVNKGKSYFYTKGLIYPYDEFLLLLQKEFCRSWSSFPEGFIEKCLHSSKWFRVYKGKEGVLLIRLHNRVDLV